MPTTTNYIWDEQNYLAESDANNVVQTVYTNEPQQFGNLISSRLPISGTPTTFYHHFDAIGSTRQLTSTAGTVTDTIVYDAWGSVVSRTGATRSGFLWIGISAYYFDVENGFVYIRRRIYGSGSARWTSLDVSEPVAGDHRYRYASNNPLILLDPSGEFALPQTSNQQVTPGQFRGIYKGPTAADIADPPSLNAFYTLGFPGFPEQSLYQTTTLYLTFSCCEGQEFLYVDAVLDLMLARANGVIGDRHIFNVQNLCDLGPGASECCTVGEYSASASTVLWTLNKSILKDVLGNDPSRPFRTYDEYTYTATRCDDSGQIDVLPKKIGVGPINTELHRLGFRQVTELGTVTDQSSGSFSVEGARCDLTPAKTFQHPNYTNT